jgi:exonuclease III
LEQLKNTNCCTLTGNEISLLSKPNSDQGNLCIDNQYDKWKLLIFHQNIRGLRNKSNEILCHFLSESPHFLYFTEHHLSISEIQSVHIDSYTLGAYHSRNQMRKDGVCVFVKNVINYSTLNLETYSTDKDFEVCAIQLNISSKKVYILTIYRSPSGNFSKFMKNLEHILRLFYNSKMDFIICGDINLNFLEETIRVKQLKALFKTFNLISIVPLFQPEYVQALVQLLIISLLIFPNMIIIQSRLCIMDYPTMKPNYLQ